MDKNYLAGDELVAFASRNAQTTFYYLKKQLLQIKTSNLLEYSANIRQVNMTDILC